MSGRGRTWKSDWSEWNDSNQGSEDSARWWAQKRWGKKTQKSWKWEEDSGEEATNDGWGDDWKQDDDWNQKHWKSHDNRSVSSWKTWEQSWEDKDQGDEEPRVTTSHRGSFFRLGGLLSTGGRFASSGGVEGEGDWEETEEDISRKWNVDEEEEEAKEEEPEAKKPQLPTTPKATPPPTPPPAPPGPPPGPPGALKPKPKVPPKMRPTSPKHPPKAKVPPPSGELGVPPMKPRPKARPVQPAKAPPTHTWEETSSEDDWENGETRRGGQVWTPTSGRAPPKPKPMPKPPTVPPPKHLLSEAPAKEDRTLTADVEDFLQSLDVNEEASRALREAPKDVQRMILQEAQDIPTGRSASAAVKFKVQRFSRILKQAEAKSPPKAPKPPEPPGPPPGRARPPPGPPLAPPPMAASPPPPPPEDLEDSGEDWPKAPKAKPPPPPAPPPAAAPPAAPPVVPPKQQPNAANGANAANAAKTGQPAMPAESWQQQQQQLWQQQWQQWQVPVATFQPVMGQLNMMAMTMQNLAKMAMAPMTGTTEAVSAGNSKSGGTEQAIKVYAEEEAKKFVALHCLSKETEQELLTLSPEDMLNITQASKNKVDAETSQGKRNADGMEDIVVMSRIARLKGNKESTEEPKKEDAKEEKKTTKPEKKEAKAEKDALPPEVEAQLKKKVSQQSHTLLFAQRAVEFVRQHQLHTLAERALMMMAATDGEILMRSRSIHFDRQKGLRAKMRHFFDLVKSRDKSGEVEAMVRYAWDLIKKQVCPEESSRSRSKERQERHSRTHRSPSRRSRSRRRTEKDKGPRSRGRRSSRRRRSRSHRNRSKSKRAKRTKRSKSKSKESSSSSPKAKAKEKAASSSTSSSDEQEAGRKAAAAATVAAVAATDKKLQEPPAPAAGAVGAAAAPPVAAPKGKVAAKSGCVGARSKAKSSPGDGRSHVKKVAAAFSHDDLEVEVQAMHHEESVKAAKAAKLAEDQRRSKIEFQIKSPSDPVARMLKLKESLETRAHEPEPAEDEGAPGPPSEAPPEEAPEPPPPPEETPEDIDGMAWQEEEEEEEAQEEAEVVPQGEHEQAAWDWLKNLDGGRGSLLKYFEVMRDEFDCDFAQLAAARLETPVSPGALGHLEPSFFEALGVEQIGHRLLLARGILALEVAQP